MLQQDIGDVCPSDLAELRMELYRERTLIVHIQAAARGYLVRSMLRPAEPCAKSKSLAAHVALASERA